MLSFLFPDLKDYLHSNEISLLSFLGKELSHTIFSIAFVLFTAVTIFFTSRILFAAHILSVTLRSMMKPEDICHRPINNILLSAELQKNHVKLFSCEKFTIPMATYSKAIFIPKKFVEDLPQKEFEAIVAHELEHILWKDPTVRLFLQIISAIFWWVPTASWKKKLDFDQEIACDQSILKYGCKEEFLASAVYKVASAAKEKTCEILCYLSNDQHPSLQRIQMMLGLSSSDSHRNYWVNFSAIIAGTTLILVCALYP